MARAVPIDPNDPRGPSQADWDAMTPDERARVVAELPDSSPWELSPPEGDAHRTAKQSALDALGAFYRSIGRRVYLSSELQVFYPGERRFVPDFFAVLDVEPHERTKWVVSAEGKGIDFVMEVMVTGESAKDLEDNVARFAQLGIPEYFVFDRARTRLFGWALPEPAARVYRPLVPQGGRWPSRVLGLDLTLEGTRLRFYYGTAPLLEADELLTRANALLAAVMARKEEAERRAEDEARRAEALRRELDEARAEIERLNRPKG